MRRSPIDLRARPLLDLVSYGRGGLGRRDHLSPSEIEHISLTVNRAPEVLIKVLTRGGQDLASVRRHLNYVGKGKDRELEDEYGEPVKDARATRRLLEDWDLDLQTDRRQVNLTPTTRRKPPKLVHKLIFSMPPGTAPRKVHEAVRNFCREEFGLQHRYALALHTDEPHPHVHVVVKAMSEQGRRLNITRETLRTWRREFARHLRAMGVEANATERAVRGQTKTPKLDGIYRPMVDGKRQSTHMLKKVASVVSDLSAGRLKIEPGKVTLLETRREVVGGWMEKSEILVRQGFADLAHKAKRFVAEMPPVRTEQEQIAAQLIDVARAPQPRPEVRVK